MPLNVTHRGKILTQAQLDVVAGVMNKHMRGEVSQANFLKACDQALADAGMPVTPTNPSPPCSCAEGHK